MKKVILGAAALMIGAVSFAQTNSVTGSQNGDSLTANAYQAGMDNEAEINQTGELNTSNSDQFGDLNDIVVTQADSNNTSDITQEGGSDNNATVNQTTLGNMSTIVQGTGMAAVGNEATVTQSGSTDVATGNTSNVKQTFDQSKAVVDQIGDSNESTVTQIGKPNDPTAPDASSFPRNEVDLDQNGMGNRAFVTQESYDLSMDKNMATVSSTGNDNLAVVEQIEAQANTATITQTTSFASAYVEQLSDGNTATISQDGDDDVVSTPEDVAVIKQEGGTGNTATTNQNTAEANDGGSFSYTGQIGSNNTATVANQGGRIQKSFIIQEGDENTATLTTQGGFRNYSDIYQNGTGHTATLFQSWSDQKSFINQYGTGHTTSFSQNGPGGGNTLNVLQEDTPSSMTAADETIKSAGDYTPTGY